MRDLQFFEVHGGVGLGVLTDRRPWVGLAAPHRRVLVVIFIDGADVAESVIIITIHVRVLIRRDVAESLDISLALTDTVVASRVVIPSGRLALQIGAWLPPVVVLRQLRSQMLTVV